MEEDFENTPTEGKSATLTLDCTDMVRQVSVNPMAAKNWTAKDIRRFLGWLLWESDLDKVTASPYQNRQDIFVLHSLLSTGAFHVDDLVRPLEDGVVETVLSLSVEKNDAEMTMYLLRMGASPDILIGPVLSNFNKPGMFASDRAFPQYRTLLLEHGKAPSRVPDKVENGEMDDSAISHGEFHAMVRARNMVQHFEKGIEYEVAQLTMNPDIVETWTRLQRTFVYSRLNQRRPHGPLESEFALIDLLLTYKGDISVDSYFIDDPIERKTALYDALTRRNLPEVIWLLEVHNANPNQVCYTGCMIWDDTVTESYPIEQALRGFLVTTEKESFKIGRMMDLLLDYGSTDVTQGVALGRVLKENLSRLSLVCLEVFHFMHMTGRIYDRTPRVFTEDVRKEFNVEFPLLLRSCEKKWFEEKLEFTEDSQNLGLVLKEVPAFLHRVTPVDRFELLPQSFRMLTIHRCYRSLGTLLKTYGGSASLIEPFLQIIRDPLLSIEAVYNDLYQATDCRPEDVLRTNVKRVAALMTIMARLFPVTPQVKAFLLQYLRVLTSDQNALLDVELYSLRNRCVSVVQQEILTQMVQQSYVVARLPPMLYSDVFMSEREFALVAIIEPTAA